METNPAMDSHQLYTMNNYLLSGQETERLEFRMLKATDFGDWLPFHQDKRTSEFWSGLPQDPEAACQQDIDRTLSRYANSLGGKLALILKNTQELVGLCGLLVQEVDSVQELEIAYSLLPKFWKKGYATEATNTCKNHAFEHGLSESLISIIHIDNIPSQKVAQNMGMRLDRGTTYFDNQVHIFRVWP